MQWESINNKMKFMIALVQRRIKIGSNNKRKRDKIFGKP